jgi:hypothetical protein
MDTMRTSIPVTGTRTVSLLQPPTTNTTALSDGVRARRSPRLVAKARWHSNFPAGPGA